MINIDHLLFYNCIKEHIGLANLAKANGYYVTFSKKAKKKIE